MADRAFPTDFPSITAVGSSGSDQLLIYHSGRRSITLTEVVNYNRNALVDTDVTLAANSSTLVPSQSAVKSYVDNNVAGLSWKDAVRVATTVNGTLATAFENGDTVDGVVLATSDRILLKNQSTATQNGIYVVAASGSPTRATDADADAELPAATVVVLEGTANAGTQWTCTNTSVTLGATNITFAQIAVGGGTYTAGAGLDLAANEFSIPNNAVSYAMLQNVSATKRAIGRNTAGAGDPEEVTATQILDWVGTPAQGDILARGASNWAYLPVASQFGVNVKSYGAAGDGVANDTAEIQAAVDVATVTGQAVYFPPGIYLVTLGSLVVPGNVDLLGAGMNLSVLKAAAAGNGYLVEHLQGNTPPAGYPPTFDEYLAMSTPRIHGLGFVYPPAFANQSSGAGLYIHDASWIAWGVHVTECLFDGWWTGVKFQNAVMCQVMRCHFWRFKKAGIWNDNNFDTDQGDQRFSHNWFRGDAIDYGEDTGAEADHSCIWWAGGAGVNVHNNKAIGGRYGVNVQLDATSAPTHDNNASIINVADNSFELQGATNDGAAVRVYSVYGRGGGGTALNRNRMIGIFIDHAECGDSLAAIIDMDKTACASIRIRSTGYGTGLKILDGATYCSIDSCNFRKDQSAMGGTITSAPLSPIEIAEPWELIGFKIGVDNHFVGYPLDVEPYPIELYHTDFEEETAGRTPDGWTIPNDSYWVVSYTNPVAGSKALRNAADGDGDQILYTGVIRRDMAVRYVQHARKNGSDAQNIAPMLRMDTAGLNGYILGLDWVLEIGSIFKIVNGALTSVGSSAALGLTGLGDGFGVFVRFEAVGSALRWKVWYFNSNERLSWNYETTDSTYTLPGYAGVQVGKTGGSTATDAVLDDFSVIGMRNEENPLIALSTQAWLLGETSGSALDAHEHYHLTANNAPTSVAGIGGRTARHYTAASSQSHSLPDEAALSLGAVDWTITGVFVIDSNGTLQVLASKSDSTTAAGSEFALIYNNSNNRFEFAVYKTTTTGLVTANNFGAPTVGVPYFIRAWHDFGSEIGIKVNATTENTTAWTTGVNDTTEPFMIGTNKIVGGNFFDGSAQDVTVWKGTVLTAEQHAFIYNGGAVRPYPWGT